MPTELENLLARRAAIAAELAALTSRPNYSIDGAAVDHDDHRRALLAELAEINAQIAALDGPWEIQTRGI